MSIESNKTYKIRSAISSTRMLNLYSSGTAANGMNVVLYTSDDSNEQKWLFDGDRLLPKTDITFCLDRYTASTYLDNADIWKASAKDAAAQKIKLEAHGIYYYILLQTKVGGKDYCLTASNNTNGNATATGKQAGADGNVYWEEQLNGGGDYHQLWFFTEDSASSSGGETGGVIGVTVPDGTYDESQTQQKYPWTDGNYNVSKDKFHSSGCSAMSATYAARIVKNNVNIKPEDLFADGIFGNSDGYPSANWGTSETYGITYTKKVKGRSDSAILADVYNQLSAGKPIIVVLANKKEDYSYTHFVLAYELASGTTSGNITQSKVKILDPWTTKNTTLKQATSYTSKWAALLNTVFVS